MSIADIRGLIPIWLLALGFVSFVVIASGPLARASTLRRFGLWWCFAVVVLLVHASPVIRLRNCAADILSAVWAALLGGSVVAAAAVGGMALMLRARQSEVMPVTRVRLSIGAILGVSIMVGAVLAGAALLQK